MTHVHRWFFAMITLIILLGPSASYAQYCGSNKTTSQKTMLVQATQNFVNRLVIQYKDAALEAQPVSIKLYKCLPDKRLGEVVSTDKPIFGTIVRTWEIGLNCFYLCLTGRDELIEWVVLHELCHIELGTTLEKTSPDERAEDERQANRCAFQKKHEDENWLTTALGQYLTIFPEDAVTTNEYLRTLLQ